MPPKVIAKPQQPTGRVIDKATRISWLRDLNLHMNYTSTDPTSASRLQNAIINSDLNSVREALSTNPVLHSSPCLHLAALFGDLDIVRALLDYGVRPNVNCSGRSFRQGDLHGITPMHLAIGAQHDSVIRLLRRRGASFSAFNSKIAAPPKWLVSERWLKMLDRAATGQSTVGILRTLKELGWDQQRVVDPKGRDMRAALRELDHCGFLEVQVAVRVELSRGRVQSWGKP